MEVLGGLAYLPVAHAAFAPTRSDEQARRDAQRFRCVVDAAADTDAGSSKRAQRVAKPAVNDRPKAK
jgi:hypothetical protein